MKKILMFGLIISAMIFIVSCATAPKKGTPTPEGKAVSPAPESEYAQAKELRARIAQFGLDQYAPDDFNAAEGKFKEGEAAYKKDNDKAKSAFKDAIKGYQAVIGKGFPMYLDGKIAEVEKIKKAAEDLKAPVAVKDDYKSAKAVYDDALKNKKQENYDKASSLLDQAKSQFQSVYNVTLAKKQKAEKNIGESKEQINELEAAAAQEQTE